MRLSRNVTVVINRMMDQWIPPAIRDAKWFMGPLMRLFAKDNDHVYLRFKERVFTMSEAEFKDAYAQTCHIIERETDLSEACAEKIITAVKGQTVLEAGCGRGYLLRQLKDRYNCTGCDVVIDERLRASLPNVTLHETRIEKLPFANASFDTVICTHTLEHVIDIQATIAELRRVTRNRLIIVVPRERPYLYTFSLHLHFFPYQHTLMFTMGKTMGKQHCELVNGDWLYIEDKG